MTPDQKNIDPRFLLANERTFLAWVRTSIAIMAFGFVVVKFSLFIKQLALLAGSATGIPQYGYSSVIGTFLVIIGVITLLFAFIRFKQAEKELRNNTYNSSFGLINTLTVMLLIAGVILVVYLIYNSF